MSGSSNSEVTFNLEANSRDRVEVGMEDEPSYQDAGTADEQGRQDQDDHTMEGDVVANVGDHMFMDEYTEGRDRHIEGNLRGRSCSHGDGNDVLYPHRDQRPRYQIEAIKRGAAYADSDDSDKEGYNVTGGRMTKRRLMPDDKKKTTVRVVDDAITDGATSRICTADEHETFFRKQVQEVLTRLEGMQSRAGKNYLRNLQREQCRRDVPQSSTISGCWVCKLPDHHARDCPNRSSRPNLNL